MPAPRRSDRVRTRRRIDVIGVLLLALVVGVLTSVVALAGGGERVRLLWVAATVAEDGSARVTEVVDYDFGGEERRGILRQVPGLDADAPVEASSPDAPDDVTVTEAGEIRVGDPDRTVTGLHRYELTYTLDGVLSGDALAWDAVGTGWDVPIDVVRVHVSAPAELAQGRCAAGEPGSTEPCDVERAEPGHLLALVDSLDPGEGVTVSGTTGAALADAPALPGPPESAPPVEGSNALLPGAVAGGVALLAATVALVAVRRAGRERVPAVGIPVTSAPGEQARIDLAALADHASPSPTLPAGLTPAQGGVLLAGSVTAAHQSAWLIDQAVAGTVDLEAADGRADEVTLVRREPGKGPVRRLLDLLFRDRERLPLGEYDEGFAEGWAELSKDLAAWQAASGLWDVDADRRTVWIRVLGGLAGVAGFALALFAGYLSISDVGLPLALAGIGGALAGAGAAAAIAGWELRVLTPAGSAAWLQVESLRQFLASSPLTAVDQAIGSGQLGRYTAWAVALGEAERWAELASAVSVPARSSSDTRYLHYAAYAPVFVAGCGTASTAPSSSSGTGGASVGGGAGGGGGGSW
ncbi:DUF2207 domain-containing protein [Blastococcus sp. VKM Ac-2987]|uniref:DUF2207 domain-containing protein n=1 Tax=Blastococcus sp. VKM Ac-2987 TaxID=3004141 RepID=UPI0022AB6927|nr:DUF2207 domain-containing protein [Blastococcus sp. VKM Ac-2987]MCZ2857777.1 DUF2207 domain-containing protein [Blastococcus sp. VKM Ac-2987]